MSTRTNQNLVPDPVADPGVVDPGAVIPSNVSVQVIQTEQQKRLESLKVQLTRALIDWYSPGRLEMSTEAFMRMFPGINGVATSANGRIESTSFLGEGCIAYSGFIRLGSDVFETTMTPNKMQDQLDNAWLPTRLDTDPMTLTFPILGGAIVNGVAKGDYDPETWKGSINLGATLLSDDARILGDEAADALPILGYRLIVKPIDNHVGDTSVVLTGFDTTHVNDESGTGAVQIYKTTLHMGITAISNFTGQITVLPLRRTGLVNLNGSVTVNDQSIMMFSGYSSERLQDYEVMMNVARLEPIDKVYRSDFALRIEAKNAIVYALPIYPMLSDYTSLIKLIQSGSVRAYCQYLHSLANNVI